MAVNLQAPATSVAEVETYADDPILELRGLKTYFFLERGVVKAVDGVTASLGRKKTLGVVGESGCGKSVTFRSVMRLVQSPPGKIVEGEILLHRKDGNTVDIAKLDPRGRQLRNIRGAEIALPPVEERLPLEPYVVLNSGMADGIGVYGGVWRDFSACPTEGYNRGAGQSAGWFGIEAAAFASLLKFGPIYRRSDSLEPLPFLARSWEWSEDGYELTMNLLEGAKWSDGHPFTTEDILFTWEDMIVDSNVQSPKGASAWMFDGEMTQLEAIDDYTFKFVFPVPFPVQALFQMDEGDFHVSPSHILKPLHPKYNESMDYVDFEASMPPDQTPVVLGPFVPVEYITDELMILRRNPYFWGVDEAGNQLPYLDEVVFEKGPSGVGRTLSTLAGSGDHSNLENPSTFIETLKRAEEDDAHFYVEWGPETLGFSIKLNLSSSLGVNDDRDAAVRELFRDVRFRRAFSFALDREGISQSILRGPFLRG